MGHTGRIRFPGAKGTSRLALAALFLAGVLPEWPAGSGETGGETPAAGFPLNGPEPVTEADFAVLKANSPFLRSLDLSESLVLTGIAHIEGELVATLFDRETRETHLVSRAVNAQGWSLAGVQGDLADLQMVTVQILADGGEVFTIRFDENQLHPSPETLGRGPGGAQGRDRRSGSPAANYREGISGDGFRGPPPPEVVAKLSRLSEEQRERLIRQIGEIRDRHREMSSEQRQALFVRMVDRALNERR